MKSANKIISMLLATVVAIHFYACSHSTAGTAENNSTETGNIAIAKKAFEAFNEHDWVKQASYFSDTCKFLDPSYGKEYVTVSRKEKVEKYSKMEQTSPDIRDDITSIFASGDKVVVQFTSSGTAKADAGEYKWQLPVITVFTIKDSLIIQDETYYDR